METYMSSLRTALTACLFVVTATLAACSGGQDTGTGDTAAAETHTCAQLCTLYFTNCSTYQTRFADESACEAACPTTQGTPGDDAGNSIECRYYHASQAANDDHCDEADGDQSCVD
jgi:hypothetical protein